ncbi:hypothetical protein [Cupriavidus nantongensis]|uniref:Uncharacterized protein n=1 Tax=Cupriavidus nantongensis TaxID=1796606 RepID=A0A142JNH8_9BURK|nr:hypothetical protein [Cupriavidus nantongensis]AMR79640.1 hypothetical protein A2G96_18850 [Cupriavidus nantongensis]
MSNKTRRTIHAVRDTAEQGALEGATQERTDHQTGANTGPVEGKQRAAKALPSADVVNGLAAEVRAVTERIAKLTEQRRAAKVADKVTGIQPIKPSVKPSTTPQPSESSAAMEEYLSTDDEAKQRAAADAAIHRQNVQRLKDIEFARYQMNAGRALDSTDLSALIEG